MTERLRPGKSRAESQGRKDQMRQKKSRPSEQEGKSSWQPSSKVHESILSDPYVTLHAGNTPESYEAFEVLDKAGIHFRVVRSDELKTPYVAWGEITKQEDTIVFGELGGEDEGFKYEGIEGAQFLVGLLSGLNETIDQAAIKRNPREFEGGDPEYGKWRDQMLERQRKENHLVMYPEIAKPKKKPQKRRKPESQ